MVACFILALTVLGTKFVGLDGSLVPQVAASVSADLPTRVAGPHWSSYTESLQAGQIAAAGHILELNLSFAVESLPALSFVGVTRKNGYAPEAPAEASQFSLVLYDNQENILLDQPFDIPLEAHAPPMSPDGAEGKPQTIDLSEVDFTLTVPWQARAREAVIFDSAGYEVTAISLVGVPFQNNTPNFMTLSGDTALEVLDGIANRPVSQSALSTILAAVQETLLPTAHAANDGTLDIAIVGDDYTRPEMKLFYQDVEKIIAHMLTYEPYQSRAAQIQFHAVENTTDLKCVYNGRSVTCNNTTVTKVVNDSGVPYDRIYVLVDNDTYGGAAYYGGIGAGYNGVYSGEVFVHEVGHSFPLLLDEYLVTTTEGAITNTAQKNCYRGTPPASEWAAYEPVAYNLECNRSNWYRSSPTSIMREINQRYFNPVSVGIINDALDVVAGPVMADVTPPTVALTAPTASSTYSGDITFAATASDDTGVIQVAFLVDGAVVGTDATAPYTYVWQTSAADNGNVIVTAKAQDVAGNITETLGVSIAINNVADVTLPTVSITSPTDGATVADTVAITADAVDAESGVASVEFYVDGALVGVDTAAPYSFMWNTVGVSNGAVTLGVLATDVAGNVASSSVLVTVQNTADTVPPAVIIMNPLNGAVMDGKGSTAVSVYATDNRAVTETTIIFAGTTVATCAGNACDYAIDEKGLATGDYLLTATAQDAAGNTAEVTITLIVSKGNAGNGVIRLK